MDYRQVRNKIQRGEFQPLYLFSGSDNYLKEKMLEDLLKEVEKRMGQPFYLERVDGREMVLNDLLQSFQQVTIFSQGRMVWVSDAPYFSSSPGKVSEKETGSKKDGGKKNGEGKKDAEKELSALARRREKDLIVVFSVEKVDRRKKIVKAMEKAGMLVEFPMPKGQALFKWVGNEIERQGKRIDDRNVQLIVERVGDDLALLRNEIDKIVLYLGADLRVTEDIICRLVPESRQGNIFNLVGAIGKKNVSEAFYHLNKMRQQNEHPMVILTMIARQFRLLYQSLVLKNEGVPRRRIASELKLPFFAAEELMAQVDLYSEVTLAHNLNMIKSLDYEIKTGQRDAGDVLELLVLKLTTHGEKKASPVRQRGPIAPH